MGYRTQFTLEERRAESERVRDRAPDRIPVICEPSDTSTVQLVGRNKFQVPSDTTLGGFMSSLRRRMVIEPEKSIFLFVDDGSVPSTSTIIRDLYDKCKDEDGFLYITYSDENTYGGHAE